MNFREFKNPFKCKDFQKNAQKKIFIFGVSGLASPVSTGVLMSTEKFVLVSTIKFVLVSADKFVGINSKM